MDSDTLSDDSAPDLADDNHHLHSEDEEGRNKNEKPHYEEYPLPIVSVLQQAELHHKEMFCGPTHFNKDEFDALYPNMFYNKTGTSIFH